MYGTSHSAQRAGGHRRGRQPAAQMAHPAIGGAEQVRRHARGAGEIAHQHEHRDDEEIVVRRRLEGLAGQVRERDGPTARPGLLRRHAERHEFLGIGDGGADKSFAHLCAGTCDKNTLHAVRPLSCLHE